MVELYCSCGRCIKLPEKYIGKAAACPGCRRRIRAAASDYQAGKGAFDWTLIIQSGPRHLGEQIILGGVNSLTVGKSDDCDIRLRDESVSRTHCRLLRGGYGWRVEDSDSKNGVYVNGHQAKARNLCVGDVLGIGGFQLRYIEALGPPPVVAPTEAPADAAKAKNDASRSRSDEELTLIEEEAGMSMTSTATAATPVPRPEKDDDESIGLADDDLEGAPPPPKKPIDGKCPECGANVPEQARLCIGCGFNFATGRRIAGADEALRAAAADAKAKAKAALAGEFGGFISGCAACAMFFTNPGTLMTFLMVVLVQVLAGFIGLTFLSFGPVPGRGMCMLLISWVVLEGFVCAYLFSVMEHAASGETDLPELNLSDGLFDGILAPFVKFLSASLVCLAPAIVYLGATGSSMVQAIRDSNPIVAVILGFGVFLWPIVMLVLGIGGVSSLMRVDLIIATLMRTIIPYLLVFILLAAVVIMTVSLKYMLIAKGASTSGGAIAVSLLLQIIQFYAAVVTMQVIGMYYHNFKNRFAWSWG